MGEDAVRYARSYALEAERRMGELLKETERAKGGLPYQTKSTSNKALPVEPTLAELGISKRESSQAQKLADIPLEKFEKAKAKGDTVSKIVKEAKRETDKEQKVEEIKQAAKKKVLPEHVQLFNGDFRELNIKAGSLDAIITDPPYSKKYLDLYEALAVSAERWLKDGGSLVAMVGQSTMPEILNIFSRTLTYQWTLAYITPGGQAVQLWEKKVNTFWKPIIWFVKGKYVGNWHGDVIKTPVNDNDKRFHEWGQNESGMDEIVKRFCKIGNIVCDPFLGAGTTGVVAVRNKMKFIGAEINAEHFKIAESRIKNEF